MKRNPEFFLLRECFCIDFFVHYTLNRLTKEPIYLVIKLNSPSRARTYNITVNSRALYHWAIEDYFLIQQIEEVPFFAPLLFFILMLSHLVHSKLHTVFHSIHQQGQAFDLLVSVSCIHYCTSTSDLSTSSSSRGLIDLLSGISYLEGGFTLRCLQRLSRPDLATRLCTW